MSDQTPDNIDLESTPPDPAPGKSSTGHSSPPPLPAAPAAMRELEPIDLEEPAPKTPRPVRMGIVPKSESGESGSPSVKELDVCPNCGASMRGGETLICLRCGFDLKTMQVVKTQTGEVIVTAAAAAGITDERPVLVQDASWDTWLPMAMAGVGALLLLIGYLSGMAGLFPAIERAVIQDQKLFEASIGQRFEGLLRFVTLSGMWTICGVVALGFVAHLLGMRFVSAVGGLWTAFLRMLGIVVVMRVATMLNIPWPAWEWVIEAAIQGAVFLGLSMLLFRLKPRDLPTFGGSTVVLFLLLWMMSHVVVWVTG